MATITIPDTPRTMEIPDACQQDARELLSQFSGILDHGKEFWKQQIADELKLLAGVNK